MARRSFSATIVIFATYFRSEFVNLSVGEMERWTNGSFVEPFTNPIPNGGEPKWRTNDDDPSERFGVVHRREDARR